MPEASVTVCVCVSPARYNFPCVRAVLAGERGGAERTVKRHQQRDLGITGISDLLWSTVCVVDTGRHWQEEY